MVQPAPARYSAEVVDNRPLSPSTRLLVLRAVGFSWLPGQYLELLSPEDAGALVPFSIACAPNPEHPGRFEVALSDDGSARGFTTLLPGARVELEGPRGSFLCSDSTEPGLFIASGTGLAPIRAMLQAALRDDGAGAWLLFGARSEQELIFGEEFSKLANDHSTFHYEPTLSQPTPAWSGRRGWVQAHLADIVARSAARRFYICGREEMVDACVRQLTCELGVARDAIIIEQY